MKYTAFHKSASKFNKFDISFKKTSSTKFGLGYNFSLDVRTLDDIDLPYLYTCEVELFNPIIPGKTTISRNQWMRFVNEIELNLYGADNIFRGDDFTLYVFASTYYYGNKQKFLDAAINILNVDGIVDKNSNTLVAFDSDAIKINKIEQVAPLVEDVIEDSKKRIEDQLGVPYSKAIADVTEMIKTACLYADADIVIDRVDFYGSRRFGKPRQRSDLDVALFYHTEEGQERQREDDLFNTLNDPDDPLYYNGYRLDVNPHEDYEEDEIDDYIKSASEFRKDRTSRLLSEEPEKAECLYHWSPVKFEALHSTPQGIHLAKHIKTCIDLAKNRSRNFSDGYLYKVYLKYPLNQLRALHFDLDPMYWDAKNIAVMLLNKINNLPIEGASKGLDDEGSNWKDANSGDLIDTDAFDKSDRIPLKKIIRSNDLQELAELLKSKNYEVITYNNYGESSDGDLCYILFDDSLIEHTEVIPAKSNLVESLFLEDTRASQLNNSKSVGQYKDQRYGKNRFERRTKSRIDASVSHYNKIDMDSLFKRDSLTINIPVIGETNNYDVTVRLDGVIKELQKELKLNHNKFEFKIIVKAVTKVFGTSDVYTRCTCADYKYRFAHWNIVHNVSTDDNAHDPGPGKGVANPNDSMGRGCKHILLVLANCDWIMKVSSVLNNYIHYMAEQKKKLFLKLIFPKLFGISSDEIVSTDLLGEEEYEDALKSTEDILNIVNEYGKNRGKIKKGSNRNTASKIDDDMVKSNTKPKPNTDVDKNKDEKDKPQPKVENKPEENEDKKEQKPSDENNSDENSDKNKK